MKAAHAYIIGDLQKTQLYVGRTYGPQQRIPENQFFISGALAGMPLK